MRRLKTRSEQGRWVLSETANGLLLAGKMTAVVSCCHENMGWGIAGKTIRNGRRKNKAGRSPPLYKGISWRRRGESKGLGLGDVSPCFHVPPFPKHCLSCAVFGMLQSGAEGLIHSVLACSRHASDFSKRRWEKLLGMGDGGRRQDFYHSCSLKLALTAFFNSREIKARHFEASFYLAQFYSNLPWAQKHSFSICQKVVLLTLKCQTAIEGWIQNWLLQRSDNSQFYTDFFLKSFLWTKKKKNKKTTTFEIRASSHEHRAFRDAGSSLGGEMQNNAGHAGPSPKPLGCAGLEWDPGKQHAGLIFSPTQVKTDLGLASFFSWLPVHLDHKLTLCRFAQTHWPFPFEPHRCRGLSCRTQSCSCHHRAALLTVRGETVPSYLHPKFPLPKLFVPVPLEQWEMPIGSVGITVSGY